MFCLMNSQEANGDSIHSFRPECRLSTPRVLEVSAVTRPQWLNKLDPDGSGWTRAYCVIHANLECGGRGSEPIVATPLGADRAAWRWPGVVADLMGRARRIAWREPGEGEEIAR